MSNEPLAFNTPETGTDGVTVPVIIENPEHFPFEPGERDRDWHVASDDEYAAYLDYWNAKTDDELSAP